MSVRAPDDEPLDIGTLGWLIQQIAGWDVSIPTGLLDDVVEDGAYGPGTVQATFGDIAATADVELSWNDVTHVVTFAAAP